MGKLVMDAVALVVYVVVSLPALTGIALHEWLGLGVFVALAVHLAQHLDTLTSPTGKTKAARWARIALGIALAIALVVVAVSGLMMSGAVLGFLGYYAEGYYFWNPLHSISAKVLLALVLIHLFVNARAFRLLMRKWRKD